MAALHADAVLEIENLLAVLALEQLHDASSERSSSGRGDFLALLELVAGEAAGLRRRQALGLELGQQALPCARPCGSPSASMSSPAFARLGEHAFAAASPLP